ncbi:hypothetical protein MBLNU459_g6805t1 [Dothideomycetes sp. NU459]
MQPHELQSATRQERNWTSMLGSYQYLHIAICPVERSRRVAGDAPESQPIRRRPNLPSRPNFASRRPPPPSPAQVPPKTTNAILSPLPHLSDRPYTPTSQWPHALFRRNTIFLGTVFASAFALEIVWDNTANKVWDSVNRGRQWKDIKQRYLESDDE